MEKSNMPIKTYLTAHKKELTTTLLFIFGAVILVGSIVLFIQNSQTKIVYQPTKACELLTLEEARELLGSKTIKTRDGSISISGNSANSECGYTDGNPDMNNMIVAAVIVRSGINDMGVEKNKADFAAGRPEDNTETIDNLGDSAYFNNDLGQLNVLAGREWVVVSYGVGETPETNTVDDAVKMVRKVID